jgi:hypothetical protein
MKHALALTVLILSNIAAFGQIQFISEIDGNTIFGMNNLQVRNEVIYFSDINRHYRYSDNDIIVLDKDDFDLEDPQIFKFFDDYVAQDSRVLISTTEGLFVQTDFGWRVYDNENSVLPSYYIQAFSSDESCVVMFTQNYDGPYFLVGDSIHTVDYKLSYENSFYMNSKRIASLNGKFYYISDSYHLIEFDKLGFKRYGKELFADDPENIHFNVNGNITENNGKIWFTTSEKYIVSFDGETFHKDDTFKNFCNDKEYTIVPGMVAEDNKRNLWLFTNNIDEEVIYQEMLIIDKEKNVSTAFKNTDPEFTMQYNGITRFTFDEQDKENQKAYISVNNQYIGIYDPATDVLEIERIPILYFHKVYPNPIKTTASIEFYTSKQNLTAVLFECSDYLGRKFELLQPVINHDASTGKAIAELDFSSALPGLYILSIKANGEAMSKLIIVE